MGAQRIFTGRKEHWHEGHRHFAEVDVRAEPCLGESRVELSPEVLSTLRAVFGPDFEHQRHCVGSAVSAQIATANVAGEMPLAGAACFEAEVVGVRVSNNAGREFSGFLLTAAGMRAIGEYLEEWENEERVRRAATRVEPDTRTATGEAEEAPARKPVEPASPGDTELVSLAELPSEDDLLRAAYQTCYVLARNDIADGKAEAEIRARFLSIAAASSAYSIAAREALEDALAGRPMQTKSPLD